VLSFLTSNLPADDMANNASFRGSIFISYRRADTPGYVRGLMSDLRNTFGSKQVFLDMEDIEAGSDFPRIIEEAVSNCEMLLAIIGPNWSELRDEAGQRRIEDANDFVRLEIAAALERKIPIIPVLVENAKMPKEEEIPSQINILATLQGIPLTHDRWDDDIARLFAAIESVTVEPRIARLYSNALAKLELGQWQEALADFETISSEQPGYLDIAERIEPLRALRKSLSGLGPKANGWQALVSKYPLILMVIVSLFPNALAAIFNYLFNLEVIVHPLVRRGVGRAEQYFQVSGGLVNGVGFLCGIALFIYFARPVSRGLADIARGKILPHETLAFLRCRCLMLGQYAALIGASLWILAGPIYPLAINALGFYDYIFFISSITLCGVFVATYPFLVVTWLCTRAYYITFVTPGSVAANDLATLTRVDSWRWRYLAMAGALPMLVLALGVILGSSIGSRSASILLGIFGVVGVVGFILALWLFRAIQADIALLKEASLAYSVKTGFSKKQLS
jgi:TIR domain